MKVGFTLLLCGFLMMSIGSYLAHEKNIRNQKEINFLQEAADNWENSARAYSKEVDMLKVQVQEYKELYKECLAKDKK